VRHNGADHPRFFHSFFTKEPVQVADRKGEPALGKTALFSLRNVFIKQLWHIMFATLSERKPAGRKIVVRYS
jgi:hypothetical protein